MSTENEQTLQINKFGGVDRYLRGTINDPNKFDTLQNFDVKTQSELVGLGGVVNIGTGIPGNGKILNGRYLKPTNDDPSVLLFCNSDPSFIDTPPTPTFNGATPGVPNSFYRNGTATGSNADLIIEYVGMGMASLTSTSVTIEFGSNGLFYLQDSAIPDYVCQINVYGKTGTNPYTWFGSLSRRAGVFAAPLLLPFDTTTCVAVTASEIQLTTAPAVVKFVPGVGGNLIGGRTYYFAVAAHASNNSNSIINVFTKRPRVYLSGTTSGYFSYTLPPGFSSITIQLPDLSTTFATGAGNQAYSRNVLFVGVSPEDLVAVCDSTNGSIIPVAQSDLMGAGINVKEIPVNSDKGIDINVVGASFTDLPPSAPACAPIDRSYGHFSLAQAACAGPGFASGGLSVWRLPALPFSTTTAHQILPVFNVTAFDTRKFGCTPISGLNLFAGFFLTDVSIFNAVNPLQQQLEFSTVQYSNRIYIGNGDSALCKTNGYITTPIFRTSSDTASVAAIPPTGDRLALINNKIIVGGRNSNTYYTAGTVVYSTAGDPNAFSVPGPAGVPSASAPGGTPAQQAVIANDTSDGDTLVGFGIYSQDLQDSGPQNFLVIGKEKSIFSWDGQISSGAIKIARQSGFASPRCFVQTQYGPVFIGYDNAYFMPQAQALEPFGNEIRDIIVSLTPNQRASLVAGWHDQRVKIAYSSSSTLGAELDRELWLYLDKPTGLKAYSGPHTLLPENGFISPISVPPLVDARISWRTTNLYQRDNQSTFTNDGAAQARKIIISRLGLQADDFWKVINRIYLALELFADSTFTITLDFEDGSSSINFTKAVLAADGTRQLVQTWVPSRVIGRVTKITFDVTSSSAMSIFEIDLLFQQLKRRKIR